MAVCGFSILFPFCTRTSVQSLETNICQLQMLHFFDVGKKHEPTHNNFVIQTN